MIMSDFTIIIDTREQKPYSFYGMDVIHRKLDTGDYSIDGYEDVFTVERKSLDDYLQSITHERTRFEDEVERGSLMREFEVVIEADEQTVRDGDYYPNVAPLAAINTANAWEDRYGTPFHWAKNRASAKALTLQKLQEWFEDYQPQHP